MSEAGVHTFSCCLIGEGSLPIQCAKILLGRGHLICSVISPDPTVINWAFENEIPCLDSVAELFSHAARRPFDYLFSIVNYSILPKEVLELPRCAAINYHDALLPRYAGVYATSWAIMNCEQSHGITWHKMSTGVDQGDILKQQVVPIASRETALTLNTKCYFAAVRTFTQLVNEISEDRVSAMKQDLSERTYFPKYKRPPSGCLISFERDATQIDAFIRALNFGKYPNPLGVPKIAGAKDFIVITESEVLDSTSGHSPGTIAQIDSNAIKVCTASQDIALRNFQTIDGRPLETSAAAELIQVSAGNRFTPPAEEFSQRITNLNSSACKHEAFWVERLTELRPFVIPGANSTAVAAYEKAQYASIPVMIPDPILALGKGGDCPLRGADLVLAAFAVSLGRWARVDEFDIGIRWPELDRDTFQLECLFAPAVPLHIRLSDEFPSREFLNAVRREVEVVKTHGTYARDVVSRFPSIRQTLGSAANAYWHYNGPTIAIDLGTKSSEDLTVPGSKITLAIPDALKSCRLIYDQTALNEEAIHKTRDQLVAFLTGIR